MPQAKLIMTVDAQNKATAELNKAIRQIEKLKKQLGQTEKQTEENTRANNKLKRSLRGMKESTAKARGGLKKMGGALTALGAVFAGGMIIDGIKDASAFQSKLASLGPDLEATRARLKAVQGASGNLFSIEEIANAESMIKAFGLELEVTPKLLQVIASKASKMGITTERAIDSLVVGMSRSSPKILDNLGLIINQKEATRRWRIETGKLTGDLTEAEKALAFQAETMRQVNLDTGEVSESFRQSAELQAKLSDTTMRLKEKLVELTPAIIAAVDGLADLVDLVGFLTRGISDELMVEAALGAEGLTVFSEGLKMTAQAARGVTRDVDSVSAAMADLLSKASPFLQFTRSITGVAADALGVDLSTPAGKPKPPKKRKGPKRATKAERDIDLQILDLQIMKQSDLNDLDRLFSDQLIEQLQLQKLRVDRTRDESGVLERKQQLLDAQHTKQQKQLTEKINAEGFAEVAKATREAHARELDTEKHKLALQILDLEISLAGVTGEEQQKVIQRQIEDLQLRKEKIGLQGRELELIEKQIKALEKKRETEDLPETVNQYEQFGAALASASSQMGTFSPGLAAMTQQMATIAGVMGDSKSTTEDVTSAVIAGAGASAAAFVDGEREKAAILAAMSFAQVAANWHQPHVAIAHGIAGAMYAAIAGGAGGGGAKKKPASGPSAGGGGGGAITVNFGSGIVLGSAQSVGRAVFEATDSVSKTGMTTGAV